jgi:hypothetical protein
MNMSRWSPTHRFRARSVRIARRSLMIVGADRKLTSFAILHRSQIRIELHNIAPGKPSQNALVDALPRLAE